MHVVSAFSPTSQRVFEKIFKKLSGPRKPGDPITHRHVPVLAQSSVILSTLPTPIARLCKRNSQAMRIARVFLETCRYCDRKAIN